jgi:hypothetical protein
MSADVRGSKEPRLPPTPNTLLKDGLMTSDLQVHAMSKLLKRSAATPAFKKAVAAVEKGKKSEPIRFEAGSPPIKVLRLIAKLIEECPDLAVESIEISAKSGCSDFVGSAVVHPGPVRIDFEWDCRWRAEQQGWTDAFGDPDQGRAARKFGYQCFRRFEKS